MDDLRLVLLFLGIVVVVLIWAFEVWRRRRNAAERDDPFNGVLSDEYSLDELPPWQAEQSVSPSAAAERRRRSPAAAEGDLFDQPGVDSDDEPELLDLPSIVATREDDSVRPPASMLDVVVPEPDHPGARVTPRTQVAGRETEAPTSASVRMPSEIASSPASAVDAGLPDDGDEEPAEHAARALETESQPRRSGGTPPPSADIVLALTVMARPGRRFVGHQVRAALESVGMRHGDMQIFHYRPQGEVAGESLFSAANVLKPGTFVLARMGELSTTGVALFMRSSDPVAALDVFDLMLEAGRHLAERLGGELCDETRAPLTPRRLERLRASAAGDDTGEEAPAGDRGR